MILAQRFLLVILLFFSCALQPVFSQNIGVLLSLRHDVAIDQSLPYHESASPGRLSNYRTLWICLDASDSISIHNFKNVIVPRDEGMWKIEVNRQNEGNWGEDRLAYFPIDQTPEVPPLDSMTVAECEGSKRLALIFVGTDFLSYEGSSDGYCQGAAHPWHVNYLKTVSLDDPNSEAIAISDVLSDDARLAMVAGAQKYMTRVNDERLNPDPDETNWGLVRRRGGWVLRGQLDYSAEVYRGIFAHFDIEFKLTDRLVRYNKLLVSWEKIKNMVPSARDALTSPDKKMTIILTKDKLLIYRSPNFKKIGEMNLYPNEFIIMAHWADRSHVEEWNKILTAIEKRGSRE